jgi:hypothetical protein
MFGLGEDDGLAEMVLGGTNQITAMLNHSNPVEKARFTLIVLGCSTTCDSSRAERPCRWPSHIPYRQRLDSRRQRRPTWWRVGAGLCKAVREAEDGEYDDGGQDCSHAAHPTKLVEIDAIGC